MAQARDRGQEEEMAQKLLQGLFAKIEQAYERSGDKERFAVQEGSSLAGDDKRTRPYQLSHAAVAAMRNSVEHLDAIRALVVDAKIMHPVSPFTLARVAIETGSIPIWLLSPRSRMDRAMRRLRLALQDAKDAERAGEEIGEPPNLPEHQKRLNRLAAEIKGDVGYELTGGVPSTQVVKAADTLVDRTHVLTAWRVCAGFSHGRLWTTLAVLDRDEVPDANDPTVTHAYISNSLPKLYWAVSIAWKVFTHAQELYEERRIRHY